MSEGPRYQLFVTGNSTLRFDTQTGKTWVLVGLSADTRHWEFVKDDNPPQDNTPQTTETILKQAMEAEAFIGK